MRRWLRPLTFGVLLLLGGAAPAAAQGFGLDLSEETPAETPAQSFGLDLSGPELRPTAAVVGARFGEEGAPASFDASLVKALASTGRFSRVLGPAEVAEKLGDADEALAARGCMEDACAIQLANQFDVDVVLFAQAPARGRGETTLALYSRDTRALERMSATNAVSRGSLAPGAADALASAIEPFTSPRALLKLTVNVEEATAKLGERTLGQGNLEVPITPVPDVLRVSAPGYTTWEQDVSASPGETIELSATLARAAPQQDLLAERPEAPVEVRAASTGTELYERPGFFLVIAGVAALGLGFGIGASATSVEGRAVDANGDGALDVTRAEALGAERSAVLANVLVASGVALAGGGVAWLVLTPSVQPAPAASVGSGSAVGLVLSGGF